MTENLREIFSVLVAAFKNWLMSEEFRGFSKEAFNHALQVVIAL